VINKPTVVTAAMNDAVLVIARTLSYRRRFVNGPPWPSHGSRLQDAP
jgi:hypothetical protein